VLVGGSALAMQINHRESEDLDFAWPQARLPRLKLEKLKESLPEIEFQPETDPIRLREADDADLDLRDFMQNHVLDETRVQFFAPDKEERTILEAAAGDRVNIATVEQIFAMKALVCAKRSKSRDWFDLYILMRDHGYTFDQFHQVFMDTGAKYSYDVAVSRLCSGRPPATDEGYHSLTPNPPSIVTMNEFFTERKNAYEVATAEREARRKLTE
jgi:predicted nucleotidyltransferase component of viral defense system